jgi:hypothetical protein
LADDGIKDMNYFGTPHIELEQSHTQTAWFQEETDDTFGKVPVSDLQWEQAMEVADGIFET